MSDDTQDHSLIIASLKAQIRFNVTLTLEGRFFVDDETKDGPGEEENDGDQIAVRLDYSF